MEVVDRLKHAEIECCDALKLIPRYYHPDVLIYADPPYLGSSRDGRQYRHEMMRESDHIALLEVLRKHPGPVVLSGVPSPLYDEVLGWHRVSTTNVAEKAKIMTECLWLSPEAVSRGRQIFMFED
jgi:DNA adenine methylase